MKLHYIITIIALLLITSNIDAQEYDEYELLKQAHKEYSAGKFQDAVEKYQKLVNSGYISGELFYNLGNAYYRINNYKSAILYYEKANLIMPENKNIAYNLAESQKYVRDKIEPIPEFFLTTWLNKFESMFSERTWAMWSILAFIIFLSSIIVFLYTKKLSFRKLSFYIGIFAFFVTIISFYGSHQQCKKTYEKTYAIVFSPAVTIKSAPNESGTELFIIHEGLKVKLIGELEGWKEIKLADGRVGWLQNETIREI